MKKIIMALSLCVFSFAAFAGEENKERKEIKEKTSTNVIQEICTDKTTKTSSYNHFFHCCITVTVTTTTCKDNVTGASETWVSNRDICFH